MKTVSLHLASRRAACAALCAGALAGCATAPNVRTPARMIGLPPVRYPAISRKLGEQGRVLLALEYDATGTVLDARVVESSGSPRLDAAAVQGLRGHRLQPGTRNGVPEAGVARFPIRFKLEVAPAAPAASTPDGGRPVGN